MALTVDAERNIGAPPWGEGLQRWTQRSPVFNLDKTNAAVQVVAAGLGYRLLTMWEPYAMLRAMGRPVDLLVLNTHQHPTSQPAVRYASQQDSVDWFRFWLQDYEDPDPAKAEQYERWRGLRKLRDANAPAT